MAVGPEAVSGEAEVVTYSVNWYQWQDGMVPPYIVAIVGLTEDLSVRLTTNITHCDLESLHVGMRVSVYFERQDDIWLPLFRPSPV